MENTFSSPSSGQGRRVPTLRKISSVVGGVVPALIIAVLMYAAFFVKPTVNSVGASRPVIEQRDLFYSVAMPAGETVWAVGNYGKIVISKDNGATWTRQPSGVDTHLQSIAAWDSNRAVAVGNDLTALYTNDGGKHWIKAKVEAKKNQDINELVRVRVLAGGHAVAVGEFGTVLGSDDFGASWRALPVVGDASWNDAALLSPQTYLIVGEIGRIEMTSDGGTTWTQIPSPTKSTLNSVFFRDAQNGLAAGTGGVVISTDDGGATWTQLPRITQQHIFDVMWDGHHWVLTGDKGLLLFGSAETKAWNNMSRLAGSSWHTQTTARNGVYALAGRGGIAIAKPDEDNKKSGE